MTAVLPDDEEFLFRDRPASPQDRPTSPGPDLVPEAYPEPPSARGCPPPSCSYSEVFAMLETGNSSQAEASRILKTITNVVP